jgi:hypothetical protein
VFAMTPDILPGFGSPACKGSFSVDLVGTLQ